MIAGLRYLILGAALVLVSCTTTLYSYKTDPGPQDHFRSAAIYFKDARGPSFFSKLGKNLPGYREPPEVKPTPEDLVIVFDSLEDEPESLLNVIVSGLFGQPNRDFVVRYRATAQFDGQEVWFGVDAHVVDQAEITTDPSTGEEVEEEPFTESQFSQVGAGTKDKNLFSHPETLAETGRFPFLLFQPAERRVVLTTLETSIEDPVRREAYTHGLWRNLKLAEQRFEIQDASRRLLAFFDNQSLSWIDDPSVSPADLKLLAAAVLGFQAMARQYYLSDPLYAPLF